MLYATGKLNNSSNKFGRRSMAILNGTDGNDTLTGVTGESNILNLNAGNDIGIGAEIDDTLNGAQGNDILMGAGNDPNVQGFAPANDVLNGNEGQDLLTGGRLSLTDGTISETLDITGVVILNAGDLNNGDNNQGDNASDQIVLGGTNSDGTTFVHYDQAGNNDYALIGDFESGIDKLVVSGDLASYTFGASPIDPGADKNALFYNGDLIAVIDNDGPLANANDLTTSIDTTPYQDIL